MQPKRIILSLSLVSALALLVSGCLPTLVGTTATTGVVLAQERTAGDALNDTVIANKIRSSMLRKDINHLYHAVDVKVVEGRVMLTGNVTTPQTKMEAVRLAWQPNGVKEVINEIKVVDPNHKAGIGDYSRDAWITTQVKTKLLMERSVKSVNYNVETIDGVVYLIGIAQDQRELDLASYLASTVSHVRKVVSHVRLKDDPRRVAAGHEHHSHRHPHHYDGHHHAHHD